jgi:cAMP-dependent protein kinase regulator
VKDSASKKREKYEQFLAKVDILKDMDPYERLQIADALKSIKCTKGEYVVKQVLLLSIIYKGEEGDIFFMVETGELEAFVEKNPED